jgi:hypothetical protein
MRGRKQEVEFTKTGSAVPVKQEAQFLFPGEQRANQTGSAVPVCQKSTCGKQFASIMIWSCQTRDEWRLPRSAPKLERSN